MEDEYEVLQHNIYIKDQYQQIREYYEEKYKTALKPSQIKSSSTRAHKRI